MKAGVAGGDWHRLGGGKRRKREKNKEQEAGKNFFRDFRIMSSSH